MQDLNDQERDCLTTEKRRTILLLIKKDVTERRKPPGVSKTLKENEQNFDASSKSSVFRMKSQLVTGPVSSVNKKHVSSESVDHRIVLPRVSQNSTGNQPSRTVVPPLSQSKATMVTSDSSCKNEGRTIPTVSESSSVNAAKSQKYLDYLEEMEFKIRYMKNDIEFKKSQMHSKDTVTNVRLNQNKASKHDQFSTKYKILGHNSTVRNPSSYAASSLLYQGKNVNDTGKNLGSVPYRNKINTSQSKVSFSYPSARALVRAVTSSVNSTADLFHFKASNSSRTVLPKTTLTSGSLKQCEGSVSVRSDQISSDNAPKFTQSTSAVRSTFTKSFQTPVFSVVEDGVLASHLTSNSSAPQQTAPESVYSSSDIRSVVLPGSGSKLGLSLQKQPSIDGKSSIMETAQKVTNLRHPAESVQAKTAFNTRFRLVKTSDKTSSTVKNPPSSSNAGSSHPSVSSPYKYLKPKSQISSVKHTTPRSKFRPHLKVQTAAKVISKYKLKRLSPTSASKIAPRFCQKISLSQKSGLQSQQVDNILTSGKVKVCSSPHKLDRRKINMSSSDFNATNLALSRASQSKLKIDRRQNSIPSQHTLRHVSRNKMKLDKRANTLLSCNILKRKFEEKNVHNLDKHNTAVTNSAGITQVLKKLPVRRKSKHHWIRDKAAGEENQGIPPIRASQFKWSRPGIQAANMARHYSKQNMKLLFGRQQRHLRYRRSSSRAVHSGIAASRSSHLVMIGGVVYRSSSRSLVRTRQPLSSNTPSTRTFEQSAVGRRNFSSLKNRVTQNTKLISVRGVHYHLDNSGKKLQRTTCDTNKASMSTSHLSGSTANWSSTTHMQCKLTHPGKVVDEKTLLAASRAVHRSIAIATAKFKRDHRKSKGKKQYCIFYSRFGKCQRGSKCPFIHDPEKVAMCTRFLRGNCDGTNCPFSHKASVHKMPVCLFYLRGSCSRENCPYLHVKVNPNAPLCKDFRNGFCPLGEKCKKIHSWVCPAYAGTGSCPRGDKCLMLHRKKKISLTVQQKAIAKSRHLHPGASENSDQSISSAKIFFAPVASKPLSAQPSFISLVMTPTNNKRDKPVIPQTQPIPNIRPVFSTQVEVQADPSNRDTGNTTENEIPVSQEPSALLPVASPSISSGNSIPNHANQDAMLNLVMSKIKGSCTESATHNRIMTHVSSSPCTKELSSLETGGENLKNAQCEIILSHAECLAHNATEIITLTPSIPIQSSHSLQAANVQETISLKGNDGQQFIVPDSCNIQPVIFYPPKCMTNSEKAQTVLTALAAQPSFISLVTDSHGSQTERAEKEQHEENIILSSSSSGRTDEKAEVPTMECDIRPIFQ